jgi:hypothetical protein
MVGGLWWWGLARRSGFSAHPLKSAYTVLNTQSADSSSSPTARYPAWAADKQPQRATSTYRALCDMRHYILTQTWSLTMSFLLTRIVG